MSRTDLKYDAESIAHELLYGNSYVPTDLEVFWDIPGKVWVARWGYDPKAEEEDEAWCRIEIDTWTRLMRELAYSLWFS